MSTLRLPGSFAGKRGLILGIAREHGSLVAFDGGEHRIGAWSAGPAVK